MQKKLLIPYLDGQWLSVRQLGDRCALDEINKRIEYWISIDTVDVKDVLALVDYIKINVNRDCTPEEVRGIVDSMKNFLVESLKKMKHHQRHIYDTYESTRPNGSADHPIYPAEIVELVEVENMRKVINALDVRCDRSLTPEEASQMIASARSFMLNALDRMEKYESKQTEHEGAGSGDPEEIL